MADLGSLERTVMDTLWDASAKDPDRALTVREVAATLPSHAYTTVLTVLDRLTRKGFVVRIRDGRTHHYRPSSSREAYIAEMMHDALSRTPDRDAALAYFVRTASPEQAEILSGLLRRIRKRQNGRSE